MAKSLSVTDVGSSCPSREFLTWQICLLTLFASIKFPQNFLNLKYMISTMHMHFHTGWSRCTHRELRKKSYCKACLKWPHKKTKICFSRPISLNAGQKCWRMLPLEHSAILSTFIKLPFVNKTFVLSIFEWLLKTGFTV